MTLRLTAATASMISAEMAMAETVEAAMAGKAGEES
jgi:hypothetical protein